MKKAIVPFFLLLMTFSCLARSTRAFIEGLQKDLLFTETSRGIELSEEISIKPFGALDRFLSPDAIATYNGTLNTIKLDKKHLHPIGYVDFQIKDARHIRSNRYNTVYLTTIFHEMGHAELDVFIENRVHYEDMVLMYHYKNTLKPFYKKNFSLNPHTVFHEHFAYYRSDLIDFLYAEQDHILMNNGFNKLTNTCFLSMNLKKKLEQGISLKEFKLFQHIDNPDVFYRLKISPRFIFVKGKDLDLHSAHDAKNVLEQTNTLFWSYHQTFYQFPINQKDYVKRLNQRSDHRHVLAKCREKLWLNFYKNPKSLQVH